MKTAVVMALAISVSGCIPMSATEMRERVEAQRLASKLPPAEFVLCVAKRAPDLYATMRADVRATADPQSAEVYVYYASMLGGIFTAKPGPSGSNIDVLLQPGLVSLEHDRVLRAIEGC